MNIESIKKSLKELSFQKNNMNWGLFIVSLCLLVGTSWITTYAGNQLLEVPPFENIAQTASLFNVIGSLTLVPVVEELIFRKYLVSLLQRFFSWKISVGISSMIFAILHWQKNFFPFLINGLIYSFTMKKSGTIVMPIMLHMSYNFVAVISQYIQ